MFDIEKDVTCLSEAGHYKHDYWENGRWLCPCDTAHAASAEDFPLYSLLENDYRVAQIMTAHSVVIVLSVISKKGLMIMHH